MKILKPKHEARNISLFDVRFRKERERNSAHINRQRPHDLFWSQNELAEWGLMKRWLRTSIRQSFYDREFMIYALASLAMNVERDRMSLTEM